MLDGLLVSQCYASVEAREERAPLDGKETRKLEPGAGYGVRSKPS
jgi:hypothetical protein